MFVSKGGQSLQQGIFPASKSISEQVSAANELLTNARSIRDQLAVESVGANRRLMEAVIAIAMYTEKAETAARQLALADACVGKIRARMRAHGLPIDLPRASHNEAVLAPDLNGRAVQGQSIHKKPGFLRSDYALDEPAVPP